MNQKILLISLIFMAGYIAHDLVRLFDLRVIDPARAEVAGLDYMDLRSDYDFKKAVRHVVENDCSVDGYGGGDISC